jgi:triacylglycerol esterase/lipase EstA (alpha/beta hydrolase family)
VWDDFVRNVTYAGHRLLVGTAERLLFPPSEIGRELGPIAPAYRRRRHPIVLLHGYGDQPFGSQDMARSLRRDGWTVYVFETPKMGLAGVEASIGALDELVHRIQRETGAAKVDLVGHSQGGVIARWYVKFGGGGDEIGRVVTMASPHNGLHAWFNAPIEAMLGSRLLRPIIPPGLDEILTGRSLFTRLNSGDPTPDQVRWTSIYAADFDGIVNPDSAHLDGATNIRLTRDHHGRSRGPHHFMINHRSLEAYDQLRRALLDLAPIPGTVAA